MDLKSLFNLLEYMHAAWWLWVSTLRSALQRSRPIPRPTAHEQDVCSGISSSTGSISGRTDGWDIVETIASIVVGPRYQVPFTCIHRAFCAQASAVGEHTAVMDYLGNQITYKELELNSARLALALYAHGVGRGTRVCLVSTRSISHVVAILATLRIGAAYVPLDGDSITNYSLDAVLEDAKPVLTLISKCHIDRTEIVAGRSTYRCLEDIIEESRVADIEISSLFMLEDNVLPSDCAYIIYTSGTTGKPKGVSVSHTNVTNLLCSPPGNLRISPGVRVAQLLNIAFDMCVWETLGCLLNGGTLHMRGPRRVDWLKILRTVDVVISTPSILASHDPANYPNIRVVATAGEPCPVALADKWGQNATFYNCCGPTEVTIVNTMHHHSPGTPLTIGKPTPNNTVYVLDDDMQPTPRGMPGVMWAGGPCVCLGGMMFNTGDIGRLRHDGELDYLGRIDDQVKIQGFRVELDGVSASIRACPGVVHACAVLIRDELWAFYTPIEVPADAVQDVVAQLLPKYSLPNRYKALAALPLTSNGKIDKRALQFDFEHAD
ncbi:uncharacterized protein FIBRA_04131 [Fibroporia radiculosa]|uniref:AMP-dependent synthetase/ligase domain-containing protein n=1 Tax=Fibroporia radiculosa TaxID=599839 RepID=J4GNX9_9APHY|nr:uncharacterized protein FIBRA_04131 [Fibroporia radiculosa]CCM02055.1 predicted protein [Fibroporia radiculosa]